MSSLAMTGIPTVFSLSGYFILEPLCDEVRKLLGNFRGLISDFPKESRYMLEEQLITKIRRKMGEDINFNERGIVIRLMGTLGR